MERITIRQAGGYERLERENLPTPLPRAGEVLLRTQAIGVNFADCVIRMGLYSSAKKYVGWPITPGFEVSGHVEAIAPGAQTALKPGDPCFAVTRFGGYATHVSVPASQVFPLPARLSFEEAAAFPAVFLTAWYALEELCRVRSGDRVLIHSAAGGVGSALVQIAKHRGARVVGVVGRPEKRRLVNDLGADRVIDRSSEDLWALARKAAPEGYDIVLDANGVATLADSYRHLAAAGRLVIYGFHTMLPRYQDGRPGRPSWAKLAYHYVRTPRFDPLRLTGDNRSVLAFNLSYLFDHQHVLERAMTELLGWVDAGIVRPPPLTSFPLKDVASAHRALESGETQGKLVLIP